MQKGDCTLTSVGLIIIIILSFDIAPFPYKHAQRRITLHCQRIDVDIHVLLIDIYIFEQMCFQLSFEDCHTPSCPSIIWIADSIVLGHRH